MAPLPPPTDTIAARINKFHESSQEPPRLHCGLSQCGHHCERYLWLSWRWAVIEKFEGRILRLFRRGHNEEFTIVKDLKAAGIEIDYTDDKQKRVEASAMVSGSLDGIISSGVPEAPKTAHVAEFKTHSKKSFDDMVKNGVEKSKPMHFAQMQAYMLLSFPVNRALYVAICKDDDRIYTERVRLVKKVAQHFVDRAVRISEEERIPAPCSADPTWYQCKWCAANSFCHEGTGTKEVNCRTCAHSTPTGDRGWVCERWGSDKIPGDHQRTGCRSHVFHPDLVPWELTGGDGDWTAIWEIAGEKVKNGKGGYSSGEILTMISEGIAFNTPSLDKIRDAFAGEIVGVAAPRVEPVAVAPVAVGTKEEKPKMDINDSGYEGELF